MRPLFLPIFLSLCILPITFAQDIVFSKQSYAPGETVQLEINIDVEVIEDLKNSQMKIIDQENKEVITQINLVKIDKKHYLSYFDTLPYLEQGTYTFLISDILYREKILKITDIQEDFLIEPKEYKRMRFFPGALFFSLYERNFKAVRISNLQDYPINVKLQETELFKPSINIIQLSAKSSKIFYIHLKPENIQLTGTYFYPLTENYNLLIYLVKPESSIICSPKWQCSEWSSCTNNIQTRICSDINNCSQECFIDSCVTSKSCISEEYSVNTSIQQNSECTPLWQCSEWSSCTNNIQTRICSDINNCSLPCVNDSCITSQVCIISNEPVENKSREEAMLKKEITFFTDLQNPEVIMNSLTNTHVPENIELKGVLFIKNTGDVTLTNLTLLLTGNLAELVRINITKHEKLLPRQVLSQFIWVNEEKNPQRNEYEGELILESNELIERFPIYLSISRTKNEETEQLFIENQEIPLSDEPEILGNQKKETEKTQTPKKVSPPYKTIFIVLLLIFLLLLYFFIKKPSEKKITFKDFISKIEKK